MSEPYRADLAHIHDAGFVATAHAAAARLLDTLRRRGVTHGRVVDLGCGSGVLAATLSDAGYDVLGIDLSPAMLELARARAPRAEFRLGSLRTAALPPCVAVCAVSEVLNYLFDRTIDAAALRRLFRRIHAALQPGGVLLGDVAGPGRVTEPDGTRRHFVEGDGWVVLVDAHEERRLLTRRIISFRKDGTLYRRDDEVHRQRLYTRAELVGPLRDLGFRVRTLPAYGPKPLPRGVFGILARKP